MTVHQSVGVVVVEDLRMIHTLDIQMTDVGVDEDEVLDNVDVEEAEGDNRHWRLDFHSFAARDKAGMAWSDPESFDCTRIRYKHLDLLPKVGLRAPAMAVAESLAYQEMRVDICVEAGAAVTIDRNMHCIAEEDTLRHMIRIVGEGHGECVEEDHSDAVESDGHVHRDHKRVIAEAEGVAEPPS
jgi:hypothetical protein